MDIVNLIANIVTFLGFIVSISTFFVALSFRKRITHYDEKASFIAEQKKIVIDVNGFHNLLFDKKIYDEKNLRIIETKLDNYIIKYGFLSRKTKKAIKSTLNLINNECINEIKYGKKDYIYLLAKYINIISLLIEKENIIP